MKPFAVSLRIWFLTILLNAVFMGVGMIVMDNWGGILAMFLLFLIGIVFVFPLLPLTSFLVKLSVKLPYNIPSRIVWLGFCLSGIIVLFYALLSYATGDSSIFKDAFFLYVSLSTVTALVLTLFLTRRSLRRLHYGV